MESEYLEKRRDLAFSLCACIFIKFSSRSTKPAVTYKGAG